MATCRACGGVLGRDCFNEEYQRGWDAAIERAAQVVNHVNGAEVSRQLHAKKKANNWPEPTVDEGIVAGILAALAAVWDLKSQAASGSDPLP